MKMFEFECEFDREWMQHYLETCIEMKVNDVYTVIHRELAALKTNQKALFIFTDRENVKLTKMPTNLFKVHEAIFVFTPQGIYLNEKDKKEKSYFARHKIGWKPLLLYSEKFTSFVPYFHHVRFLFSQLYSVIEEYCDTHDSISLKLTWDMLTEVVKDSEDNETVVSSDIMMCEVRQNMHRTDRYREIHNLLTK